MNLGKFLTDLSMASIRGTDKYRLTKDLAYKTKCAEVITAPHGFVTNLASIPRVLKIFIDNDEGVIRDAAVIHDYLYSTSCHMNITRKDADKVLMEAMQALGAGWLKRRTVYRSVRMFGMFAYKKDNE